MRTRRVMNILVLLVAATFLSTKGPRAFEREFVDVAGELDELPGAVADVATSLASAAGVEGLDREGRHLGFDTYQYPGDRVMQAWRDDGSPYEWVGYYLPSAPCHKGTSWAGTRERLEGMGWGLAVIYVGQQTWGGTPSDVETRYRTRTTTKYVTKRVRQRYRPRGSKKYRTRYVTKRVPVKRRTRIPYTVPFEAAQFGLDECHRNLPSAARGVMEAKDAINSTLREGFPYGTVIFLDLEYMPHVPQRYRDYYVAWTREVLEDGRFVPGYYVHKSNATLVHRDVTPEFAAAGIRGEPSFWVAGGRDFTPNRRPQEIGLSYANVWQGKLDTWQEWAGFRLPIDVNVAAVPSPSTTGVRAEAVAD